ncbi:hypothetical protein BJV82DRAFT_517070 [Fennellomyces sp. T-0311]|nr:hypothetical protein BJV82DRAFT_517070 [Fennellomyces sp. T-0311]
MLPPLPLQPRKNRIQQAALPSQEILERLEQNLPHVLDEAAAATRTAEDRAQFYKAAQEWSARTNDPGAMVWVARCLLDGWGIEANPSLGLKQIKKLAELGCWEAYYPLADYYREEDRTRRLEKEAIRWYKAAADLDMPNEPVVGFAQYRLGEMYAKGQGAMENDATALGWFEASAKNGNKYGQYISGVYYEQGIGVEKNLAKAKAYFLASANQEFADAQAALGILLVDQLHQYDEGREWLDRAAQLDNARGLLKLGIMYENGQGVPCSPEQAITYYKTAAITADDARAQYLVGLNYRLGTMGLPQDFKEAGRYLERSARAGFAPAQRIIGLMLAQGLLGRKDENSALRWFRRAACQGDVRALCLVGSCHETGTGGIPVNLDQAMDYYRKAVRVAGPFQSAAQLVLAQLLLRMDRQRDAFEWFKRAASHTTNLVGDSPAAVAGRKAMLMVARYHVHGWGGVTKDPGAAFQMLHTLIEQNPHEGGALYWLAACYEEGLPGICPPDTSKAFEYYMRAAQSGDTEGEFQIALMLSNGQGVERDRSAAFPWYEKAARKGHRIALYSLGLYYAKGLGGVSTDLRRARACFDRAARKGYVPAMTSLAILCRYETGSNMTGNDARMVYWYKKAADLGDASAQRELGMLYDQGLGVKQNYERAFQLMQKAAEQREPRATLMLGSYYQNGIGGVEANFEKALELYHEAAQLGAPTAFYASAQVYQLLGKFDEAFAHYKLAAQDPGLSETMASKNAKLMVARYALGYYYDSSNAPITIVNLDGVTKEAAFQLLFHLATQDEFFPAFYWLGNCYYQGNGTEVNKCKAFEYYILVAESEKPNSMDAMLRVAYMYEEGDGVQVNPAAALKFNQSCADKGHPEAQYNMGMAYWRGKYNANINLGEAVVWFTHSATIYPASSWALGQMAFENGDQDVAIAWWQKSIKQGHVPSMRSLAKLLLQTTTGEAEAAVALNSQIATTQDPNSTHVETAMGLLENAVRSGDPEALVDLGKIHQKSATTMTRQPLLPELCDDYDDDMQAAEIYLQKRQAQQELAIRCFEQAAAMGHIEAMFLAAQSWHSQQQFAAALDHYERAAERNHALSRVMRARYRIAGLGGITADPETGYKELLACAQDGNCVDAYNSLGQCHELGLGTKQDDRRALEWYLRSAEKTQDAEAMFRIGQMHAQGRVPSQQDDHHNKDLEALQWYRFACDSRNHPRAHYYIGLYHVHGIRSEDGKTLLQADIPVAIHHFRQAAEQDDRDAMVQVGQLLLFTDDTNNNEQLIVEGFEWLERAAQLGSAEAQCELGKLYHSGKPGLLNQDFEKAYDYFCRSAAQKDKTATLFIGTYHEHGIHVPPNLDLAREWYQDAVETHEGWWLAELALARLLHSRQETQSQAYRLFKAAHAHAPHETSATMMVALYELYGWANVPARPAAAAAVLLQLAQQGEPKTFLHVAQCYAQGLGLDRDPVKAFEWYGRVVSHYDQDDDDDEADNQLGHALYRLAEFYERGFEDVVPADRGRADDLFKLAAQHGTYASAITNTGSRALNTAPYF